MVNALKKNISQLPAGKYGKLTNWPTRRRHQANEGKSGFDAKRVQARGALLSLRSKEKLAAERRQETNILNTKEKEKWIKDYIERETAVARNRVEDAETAIKQEQDDMKCAESGGLTSREPGQMFEEMLDAIGDSLSDLASLDNQKDAEDDQDTEQGKQSEDDEPGWVMGTILKMAQLHMERLRQKQMKLDKLTQPGWGDAAEYCHERDKKYGTSKLNLPAVVKQHMDDDAANAAPTTFGELMESLHIINRISQMLQGTSGPGSSHMRIGSGRPREASLPPNVESDSSPINNAKPIEPVSLYPCIVPSS